MNKREYQDYLNSKEWLLKKHEFISVFLAQDLKIQCFVCGTEKKLRVHHFHYENLGKEEMSDLGFICADCHEKWHFEKGFEENWIKKTLEELFNKRII